MSTSVPNYYPYAQIWNVYITNARVCELTVAKNNQIWDQSIDPRQADILESIGFCIVPNVCILHSYEM